MRELGRYMTTPYDVESAGLRGVHAVAGEENCIHGGLLHSQ